MFNTNVPAGNHVIKRAQFDIINNWTVLVLCCGHTVYLLPSQTLMYKPVPGDYYIVTTHGTACIFEKSVFERYTAAKPEPKYTEAMDRAFTDMLTTGSAFIRFDTSFLFDRQTAKPETLGMREENGYVDKVNTAPTTAAEITKAALGILAGKLNPQSTPADFGVPRSYEAAAVAFAEYMNSQENAKLQNVIKSLTAQNDNKQAKINEYRKQLQVRTDIGKRLNKLVDACAAVKLI